MRGLRLKESCLYGKDLNAMRSFYEGILGLEVLSHIEGDHVFFRAENAVLLCFDPQRSSKKEEPPPHFGQGELHVAFECDQEAYESFKEILRISGVAIEQVQYWHKGHKESFYFRDPEANLVEILQPGIWENT